jgi:hypothetical protein
MLTSHSGAPLVTQPMVAFFLVLFSFPLWSDAVGL